MPIVGLQAGRLAGGGAAPRPPGGGRVGRGGELWVRGLGKRVRMGNERVRVGMSWLVRPGASRVQNLATVVVKRR